MYRAASRATCHLLGTLQKYFCEYFLKFEWKHSKCLVSISENLFLNKYCELPRAMAPTASTGDSSCRGFRNAVVGERLTHPKKSPGRPGLWVQRTTGALRARGLLT
ncbi:MAG: hypothetical protein H7234_04830 [Herminiimonas sp.]|nr:hypothetical protein [Herminiimonas sp.]